MFSHFISGWLIRAIAVFVLSVVTAFSAVTHVMSEPLNNNTVYIVSDHWPGFTEPDGSGLYLELMAKVYQAEGIRVSHKIHPVLRAIASINVGDRADVMLADWDKTHMAYNGNYQLDKVLVPSNPIFAEFVEAAFHPESTLTWSDIRSDSSKRVAWIRGYGYQNAFGLTEHPITQLSDFDQGLKMLVKGHIDCYLNDKAEFDLYAKTEGLKQISWRRELVAMHKMYPVFHNNARGQRFMAIYDRRMAELAESGELYELYRQHGFDYKQVLLEEIDPKQ